MQHSTEVVAVDVGTVGHLRAVELLDYYATNHNDLIEEFYRPCLDAATRYDRAVGYFSSAFLVVAAEPVAHFALRGGLMRIVCSHELGVEDIAAVDTGYTWRDKLGESLLRLIDEALSDPEGRPVVEFLATLVANKCLDIKIAFRRGAQGIFHAKVGIFQDHLGNRVSFSGSINETLRAWDVAGNHEVFDVFRSWTAERARVDRHQAYFDSLWADTEPGLETIPFPQVARDRYVAVANPDGIAAAFAKVRRARESTRKTPQPHQIAAIDAWRAHGRRGIIEHATGSGKTITAICAMREQLAAGKPVLVLVPSDLLLAQWDAEIRAECADLAPNVLLAGGGHAEWRQPSVLAAFTGPGGGRRVVIATLQTVSTEAFLRRIRAGDHLLVVADEVHRTGSPRLARVLSIAADARLGLSATPQRFGDPVGTARLFDYFGGIVGARVTLADAIAAGRLCPYNYFVHTVRLTDHEQADWKALTARIQREYARSLRPGAEEPVATERLKLLLIQRARIVKKAAEKVPVAVNVIRENCIPGQRWLIYCDDQEQLAEVLAGLRAAGYPVHEYHTGMPGDRDATLEHFAIAGGILIAIKCLDEGVDIPAVDHALILASSRNPREYIQRRGRVLRRAPGKYFADIHDVLVLPPDGDSDDESAGVPILRGEMARAIQFAGSARNDGVVFTLRRIAREFGIDPDGRIASAGFEDDEE